MMIIESSNFSTIFFDNFNAKSILTGDWPLLGELSNNITCL